MRLGSPGFGAIGPPHKTQRLRITCSRKATPLAAYSAYNVGNLDTVHKPRLWGGSATASPGCRLREHPERALRAALTDDAHCSEDAGVHQQQLSTAGYAQPVSRGRPARRSNALGYSVLLSSFNAAAVQRLITIADYETDVLSKQMGYTFNHKEAMVSRSRTQPAGGDVLQASAPLSYMHMQPTLRCKL